METPSSGAGEALAIVAVIVVAPVLIVLLWWKWGVTRSLGEHIGAWWKGLTDLQRGGIFLLGFVLAGFAFSDRNNKPEPEYDRIRRVWTFDGTECSDDCSEQVKGYKWAEDKNPDNDADCIGPSKSFEDGCKVWLQEREYYDRAQDDQ